MNGNRNTFGHCMQTTKEPWNVTPAANGIWSGTLMSDILSAGGIIPPGMRRITKGRNASPATSTTREDNGNSADDWIRKVQELQRGYTNRAEEEGSGNGKNCTRCGNTTKQRQCGCNNSRESVGPEHPERDEIDAQNRWDQGTRMLMSQRRNLFAEVVKAPIGSQLQAKLSAQIERLSMRIYTRTGDERYNVSTSYRTRRQ